MNIQLLLNNGHLLEAIDLLENHIKHHPGDIGQRDLFQTLLCISGDLERADQQLELIAELDPKTHIFVHTQRQLLRAEKARRECYFEKRAPEFPNGVTDSLKCHLEALIAWQSQNIQETYRLLSEAETVRQKSHGTCNHKKFKFFRDADDLCAGFLEIYLPGGTYAWLDINHVASLTTRPPKKLIDLIWQQVSIRTYQGSSWEAYMPAIYVTTPLNDEKARLAQITDWNTVDLVSTGSGQRVFMADNKNMPQLEITTVMMQDMT